MYCVYVLKSDKDERLYIGVTKDLAKRIKEHNTGSNKSTKYRGNLTLIYCECYRNKLDALTREKRLKQFKNSYTELKKRIQKSLESA